MISQYTISKLGLVTEYNGNNAWLYYGTNGKLNNNNKNNSNTVRPALEFNLTERRSFGVFVVPLEDWYDLYLIRKKLRSASIF